MQQVHYVIAIYAISIVFWLSTVIYRERAGKNFEILQQRYVRTECNGWCVLHFASYVLMGYFAPAYWYIVILLGFLFECLEWLIHKMRLAVFVDYALVKDTLTNAAGTILGVFAYVIVHHSHVLSSSR